MNVTIDLPPWAVNENANLPASIKSIEERMRAVIRFSELNVQHQTGGPFAAGVFEKESGKPVIIGVNRVVPLGISSAHAEIVTLMLAQAKVGSFDLAADGLPEHQLVISAQPCAMCYGSIPWSGVRSIVIAASSQQVESIAGFDEGAVHPQWKEELQRRGIDVTENILADEACKVLQAFVDSGQAVYNAKTVLKKE